MRFLSKHCDGLRYIAKSRDVQKIRPAFVRFGKIGYLDTLDIWLEKRGIKPNASHFMAGDDRNRRIAEAIDPAQCLDCAAGVPDSHGVEGLSQKHKAAASMSLFRPIRLPSRWSQSARRKKGESFCRIAQRLGWNFNRRRWSV